MGLASFAKLSSDSSGSNLASFLVSLFAEILGSRAVGGNFLDRLLNRRTLIHHPDPRPPRNNQLRRGLLCCQFT